MQDAWLAQLLIILEILIGLYFLTVLIATVVTWANPSAVLEIKPLEDLLRQSSNLDTETSPSDLSDDEG